MARNKQHRIKNFSGCWTEPHPAAFAVWYITSSGYIDVRTGIGAALGTVFGPVAVALQGGTVEEVETAIALSRSAYEAYLFNARAYAGSTGNRAESGSVPMDLAAPSPHLETQGKGLAADLDDDDLPLPMEDD